MELMTWQNRESARLHAARLYTQPVVVSYAEQMRKLRNREVRSLIQSHTATSHVERNKIHGSSLHGLLQGSSEHQTE